jgi:hypothetical protein
MTRFVSSLMAVASAALMLPLSVMPDGEAKCSDPSYHFVMSGPDGSTVADTSTAKTSFCEAVAKQVAL